MEKSEIFQCLALIMALLMINQYADAASVSLEDRLIDNSQINIHILNAYNFSNQYLDLYKDKVESFSIKDICRLKNNDCQRILKAPKDLLMNILADIHREISCCMFQQSIQTDNTSHADNMSHENIATEFLQSNEQTICGVAPEICSLDMTIKTLPTCQEPCPVPISITLCSLARTASYHECMLSRREE
ncbi:hypothetical protein EB796_004035 [Bugula neritina]|uniref:Uncharacterized protein n=1 Tax=Bugula neritina TaxID=10212 RepID=A0A7J7KHH0_BUGNE|nr:hypothetical protein EB796_004035 [Bugula neritina]